MMTEERNTFSPVVQEEDTPEVRSTAEDNNLSLAIDNGIDSWFKEFIQNSVVSRNPEVCNQLKRKLPQLAQHIKKELKA
jgi:AAA+ ATPase superfamily predicted ATPase